MEGALQYLNAHMSPVISLPTGSEERGVLCVGSIPVAILPLCQDMKSIALLLHQNECSWVVKITNTSEAVYSGHNTPLGPHTE